MAQGLNLDPNDPTLGVAPKGDVADWIENCGLPPETITAVLLGKAFAAPSIHSAADLPADVKEAIGWVEPYVTPEGVPPQPENGTFGEHGYYVIDGGRLCLRVAGKPPKPLCTFDAWIEQDTLVQHDDGRDAEHIYKLRGLAQGAKGPIWLPDIRVPTEDFPGGKWETAWGYHAFVYPGRTTREHLATAVRDRFVPPNIVEYTSPGWHEVGKRLRFLHCNGAVGDPTIQVAVAGGFDKFTLPTVPEHAKAGVAESLWLLRNLAPLRVMASIIGCVFRAPLCHWRPAPITLYIAGTTGVGKSTLAAVAASWFGDFPTQSSLFGWSSSANALEDLLFLLKDHLIPMDDVVADGDRQQLLEKINRVVRAQGNIAGRRRMTASLDHRHVRTPRGLPLITGEIAPTVSSLIARCILIELHDGDVRLKGGQDKPIDRAQRNGLLLRHAMAGYVEWIGNRVAQGANMAGEIEEKIARLRSEFREAATEDEQEGEKQQHARIPENVAHAALGMMFFLDYAVDLGAITRAETVPLMDACVEALVEVAHDTSMEAGSHHSALAVMAQLQQLLIEGRIRLLAKGESPIGEGLPVVGWADDDHLYLPRAGLGTTLRAARDSGNPILLTEDRIMRELAAKHLLVREPGARNLNKMVRVVRAHPPQRVYTIKRSALAEFMGAQFYVPGRAGESPPADMETKGTPF